MASRFAVPVARACRLAGLLLAGLTAASGFVRAVDAPPIPAGGSLNADESSDRVAALARVIDREVAARWSEEQIQPAPAANDAEFLRRTYLNIAGRIPSCTEVQTFLEEKRPDKRQRIVD